MRPKEKRLPAVREEEDGVGLGSRVWEGGVHGTEVTVQQRDVTETIRRDIVDAEVLML